MFSFVQKEILVSLITSEGLKYSALRPKDVADDLYNYHLQELVKKGYVQKGKEGNYALSPKGKKYVLNLDSKGKSYNHFNVRVLSHVIRDDGFVLMQKRLRHPYKGDTHFGISGKVTFGEHMEAAAKRKLKEETGLNCDFKLLGVVRKTRREKNNEVFEDTFYHSCLGFNPTGDLIKKNAFGEHFWDTIDNALKFQKSTMTNGPYSEEVIKRIAKKNYTLFYFHEEVTVKEV